MSYSQMNDTDYGLQLKQGLRANLLKTATSNAGVQGEPHYTTDTKQLFIHDGTVAQPVQSLDMAVMFEDEVVSYNDEIVFNF